MPANDKALNDLCFLYPKHKLVRHRIKDTTRKIHSNNSVANKLILKIGNNTTKTGKNVQCNTHNDDAAMPTLSKFISSLL